MTKGNITDDLKHPKQITGSFKFAIQTDSGKY